MEYILQWFDGNNVMDMFYNIMEIFFDGTLVDTQEYEDEQSLVICSSWFNTAEKTKSVASRKY